ncbi:hypothetical protein [Flavobacterium pectinovorum]|uniref:DUF4271 domain-containing protein n=1 Tax=Flavobacterium pectinovorum TaxID=29533 RepID=A0ABY1J2T4_9FLAO|nr:hypothetical protein [Flavobacterium pectinovorum]SHM16958.1 hypothetical protein SAMN05444387_2102 [Flavobacterium pectinovorum]
MKKIFFLLFLFSTSLFAKEIHPTEQIASLNDTQKKILYEFAVLQKSGSDANAYWLKHKNHFSAIHDSVRNQLAQEIYVNAHVVYVPVKDSAVQIWMQTQSLTNWMLYLAAFIAICAIIALLRNYWNLLIGVLIRQFAPLFRLLFSAILLTYELLLIGVACIILGCYLEEMTLRTVVIHTGLFLLWSQSTAIFTRKYLVQKYVFQIKDNFWGNNKWETVKTICLPAIIVTVALLYVLYKVPGDTLYNYEIVVSGMAAICALPFWRVLEKYISPILIPYKDTAVERSIYSLAACMVLALLIDGFFIGQHNSLFSYVVIALTSLLIISFLLLSLKHNFKYNYKNYYYLQFITILFLSAVLLYSFYIHSGEMIWASLIGTSLYVIIKYWEIPTFFVSWKRSKTATWGFLGMAVLLWLLAKGILYVSGVLYVV